MKRIASVPAAALPVILLVSSPAFASGGADLFAQKLGIQIADFLVVIIPLLLVLIPLVRRSLIKRHEEVKASIDAANAEFAACAARLKAAEDQLAEINAKMESIRQSFRDLADDERRALEQEATDTAVKLRREADMRISQAALTARSELADEVVTRALAMVAGRIAATPPTGVPDAAVDRMTGERD